MVCCPDPQPAPTALLLHRYAVARVIWADMLSIAVTYFITLCLFPGLESEIRHCVLGEWLPILAMAVFNLSDFVGKVGPPPHPAPWRRGEDAIGGAAGHQGHCGSHGWSLGKARPFQGCTWLLGAEGGSRQWHCPQTTAIEGGPDGPQASAGVSAVSRGLVPAPTFTPRTH